MEYCSSCGKQISESAKFCSECGAKIIASEREKNNLRKVEYDGEIHKCPSCGDVIESFVPTCKSCGYELRGYRGSDSVKNFEYRFQMIDSVDKKIDLIKTFLIPNTKEDVREFIILALSNIDPDVYNSSKETTKYILLSDAWISKFHQAYEKSKRLFDDESEVKGFYEIYLKKEKKIKSKKREGRVLRFFSNNKKSLSYVGCVLLFFLLWGSLFIPDKIYELKLERLVEDVEKYIDTGDYDSGATRS